MGLIFKNLTLSIYRPHVFSIISIIHRITIIAMVLSLYVFFLTYSVYAFSLLLLLVCFHLIYIALSSVSVTFLFFIYLLLPPVSVVLFVLCLPPMVFIAIK